MGQLPGSVTTLSKTGVWGGWLGYIGDEILPRNFGDCMFFFMVQLAEGCFFLFLCFFLGGSHVVFLGL